MLDELTGRRTGGTGRLASVSPRHLWLGIALGFVFVEGLGNQLLGPLLPVLMADFGVSPSLGGTAGTVKTLSFVVAVVLTGALLGYIRVKRGLLLGLACVVVALGAMATAPVFLVFLVGLGARSLGAGVVRGVDKPVLSHLFPGRRDRLLNVYELTWAFGAAAAPLVATLATAYATWEAAYVLVALLVVPILALAVRAPLPVDALDEQPLSLAGIRELSGDARVRGMTVGLLLSGGIEGGLFLWLPTYLGEFVAPTTANLAFSAFFLTYIPARVFHTVYAPRVGYLRLLVGSGLGTAVLLAYGFALGDGLGIVVSLTLAGFFVAGLFPLLSAYGIAAVPERSGPVNGLSLGAGFAGSSLTPLAIGVLIERFSLRLGMQLLCAYAVVLVAVLVVMLAYERRAPDGV